MKTIFCMLQRSVVSALLLSLLLLAMNAVVWAAAPKLCGDETLNPFGNLTNNYLTDLQVTGKCMVNGTPKQGSSLLYVFHNVNIVSGGQLIFQDNYDIDFYAENIVVENNGKLIAVSTQGFLPQVSLASGVLPYQKRLTFHLWGPSTDPGVECASTQGNGVGPCGIPNTLWTANPVMAMSLMMNPPPLPATPKNQACNHVKGYSQYLPGDDCFYQYEIQDPQDKKVGRQAFFGHKVLAVSFGGTLQLFGSKGVSYLQQGQQCMPKMQGNECNPAFAGTSWVRLTALTDKTHITVNRGVDWKKGDHIVVTPTDYLPSHAEEVILASDAGGGMALTLQSPGLQWDHNAAPTKFPTAMPMTVGPQDDPNTPDIKRAVDTRAAVALLNRNIQVVSEGDVPSEKFTEKPGNYYGGHTIVRQGFASFQVQGAEFYQLGQGGQKGRYPVHFHMDRATPQAVSTDKDPTPEPLNYLKDCSIWDSMTRWVTLHGTQGMYLARNVGYKSIGHGYYQEDATEIDNRLYSNIGVLARAAIMDTVHNPRQVPGILADNTPTGPQSNNDYMPFRSDYNHPTIFWITNGWNDFQYNFAAGAATCGACYWWLPAAVSGPSQYQTWDGYASQQITTAPFDWGPTNYSSAGLTPLEVFNGNSCVAAMSSFQMNGQTADCLGVQPDGSAKLSAVKSSAPKGPNGLILDHQPFNVYYPVLAELHNPTLCSPGDDLDTVGCPDNKKPCDGGDYFGTCVVTPIDHYTTSFNFAQTNFAAVWLRQGWDLVTNTAVTDVQSSGLNFVTGGGYERSDVKLGEWLVARNTVLIGHTQGDSTGKYTNPYAMDVGPFNPVSKLACDNQDPNRCEYGDGGVSFNLPVFPGQKLLNIYDGPSQQDSNAYLNINVSTIADCNANGNGNCANSKVPLARNFGLLKNKSDSSCYLPNAAIGWKQPNGFYYPPAFHSKNLWFDKVDIRHFVVEPLFKPINPGEQDPFQQDQGAVQKRYCTYSNTMFSNFNHIDRQTVLNDDDGTLTGLVGQVQQQKNESISINEDPWFNAALVTPECLSDINVKPPLPLPKDLPFTASTSPYEWLSVAMLSDCVKDIYVDGELVRGNQCFQPSDKFQYWAVSCTTPFCRGLPLYREYYTTQEGASFRPQIRMGGQATGQRSTLSLNHGAYYIDTTQDCTAQGGCPKCLQVDPNNQNLCVKYDGSPWFPTVFLGGHTYYVYFIYAKDTMKQTYDIYVGPNTSLDELKVKAIQVDPTQKRITTAADGSFIGTPTYAGSILSVSVDLSGQSSLFNESKAQFCRPKSYCSPKDDGSCGCNPDNKKCVSDADCAWGPNDMDCPVTDPNNPNATQCFGFSFTMPMLFKAKPMPPDPKLFKNFTDNPYFAIGNVTFAKGKTWKGDVCSYTTVPVQQP